MREDKAAARARDFLFCDTTPLVTLFYCRSMFGRADPRLEALAERRYDHSLLCAPDIPFVQDGWREDDAFRRTQHEFYLQRLLAGGQPFTLIEGPWEARLAAALGALGV